MLKNSLRVRLLLPVLALGLVAVTATAVILAWIETDRVENEARVSIDSQVSDLQSLFAVTHAIMLDRVRSSIRLLRQESDHLGTPSAGQAITAGSRQANDLVFGNTPQGNNFQMVDDVTSIMDGTATLFSATGDDFVRVSTNVKKDDGSRAVGTILDPKGPVIAEIRKGLPFYGVVDILGSPYVTGYEPIYMHDNLKPIGIWYVGYKTDVQALDKVISDTHVFDSGFIALIDGKGVIRFHSKTGETTDPSLMNQVIQNRPSNWMVEKYEVPDWGFSLVAAYPNTDITHRIVQQIVWIALCGLLICLLLLGLQYVLIQSRVLRPIKRLTEVADAISMGKMNNIIQEVKLEDEIGTLAKAISRLSNSVRLAMERLSKR